MSETELSPRTMLSSRGTKEKESIQHLPFFDLELDKSPQINSNDPKQVSSSRVNKQQQSTINKKRKDLSNSPSKGSTQDVKNGTCSPFQSYRKQQLSKTQTMESLKSSDTQKSRKNNSKPNYAKDTKQSENRYKRSPGSAKASHKASTQQQQQTPFCQTTHLTKQSITAYFNTSTTPLSSSSHPVTTTTTQQQQQSSRQQITKTNNNRQSNDQKKESSHYETGIETKLSKNEKYVAVDGNGRGGGDQGLEGQGMKVLMKYAAIKEESSSQIVEESEVSAGRLDSQELRVKNRTENLSQSFDCAASVSTTQNAIRRRRSDRSKPQDNSSTKKKTSTSTPSTKLFVHSRLTSTNDKKYQSAATDQAFNMEIAHDSKIFRRTGQNTSPSVSLGSSNVVEFANILLAKHEANMKQREIERAQLDLQHSKYIASRPQASQSKLTNLSSELEKPNSDNTQKISTSTQNTLYLKTHGLSQVKTNQALTKVEELSESFEMTSARHSTAHKIRANEIPSCPSTSQKPSNISASQSPILQQTNENEDDLSQRHSRTPDKKETANWGPSYSPDHKVQTPSSIAVVANKVNNESIDNAGQQFESLQNNPSKGSLKPSFISGAFSKTTTPAIRSPDALNVVESEGDAQRSAENSDKVRRTTEEVWQNRYKRRSSPLKEEIVGLQVDGGQARAMEDAMMMQRGREVIDGSAKCSAGYEQKVIVVELQSEEEEEEEGFGSGQRCQDEEQKMDVEGRESSIFQIKQTDLACQVQRDLEENESQANNSLCQDNNDFSLQFKVSPIKNVTTANCDSASQQEVNFEMTSVREDNINLIEQNREENEEHSGNKQEQNTMIINESPVQSPNKYYDMLLIQTQSDQKQHILQSDQKFLNASANKSVKIKEEQTNQHFDSLNQNQQSNKDKQTAQVFNVSAIDGQDLKRNQENEAGFVWSNNQNQAKSNLSSPAKPDVDGLQEYKLSASKFNMFMNGHGSQDSNITGHFQSNTQNQPFSSKPGPLHTHGQINHHHPVNDQLQQQMQLQIDQMHNQSLFKQQQQHLAEQLEQIKRQDEAKVQFMISQYELIIQQLNQQTHQLLLKNQNLESIQLQQEIAIQSLQGREVQMQQTLKQEKAQNELQIGQIIENQQKVTKAVSRELEDTKQTLIDLETQANQMSLVIQQQNESIQNLEVQINVKEQLIQKMRIDNQNMFIDLKALAQNEERMQRELVELRRQRTELETQNESLIDQVQRQQAQIRQHKTESEGIKRDMYSRQEQLPLMIRDIENLQEENRILIQKQQQSEQQLANLFQEKERSQREARSLNSDLMKANMQIQSLQSRIEDMQDDQQQMQVRLNSTQQKSQGLMGRNNLSVGRQVFKTNDLNTSIAWPSQPTSGKGQSEYQMGGGATNAYDECLQGSTKNSEDLSPFRNSKNSSNLGGPKNDVTPIKGRFDPNMAHHARQNIFAQQEVAQISQMNITELLNHKSKLETEYQKIPITVSRKSMQVRKRKEELEYELDLIEKQIYRARKSDNGGMGGPI